MAQNKYDLLLVTTKTDKTIRNQPWYKERLKIKYLKSRKPTDSSKTLIGSEWSFLKSGLDDFRDGLPPPVDDEDGGFLKGKKGPEPNLKGDVTNPSQTVNRKRFTKHQVVYSKALPLHQMRQDHIEEMEYGLTQHPLALYPHLEECMPPDVFEDVVDILDPEMNLGSEADDEFDEFDDAFGDDGSQPQQMNGDSIKDGSHSPGSQDDDDSKTRNPYRWLPGRKEDKDDKKHSKKRSDSPSQDGHIKDVTKEFCDWVASLGGESNNVEEATIHSLFASGYETKPALSVPIHVVELTNVPPELRMSAQITPQGSAQTKQGEDALKDKMGSTGYQPSWIKHKYGSWYLNPKTWKKRPANEPLQDPQELKDKEMSESKKNSLAMDEELAPLHGAKAFKDFIETKNNRMPEFLNRVADFQEKAKAAAEAAAEEAAKKAEQDRSKKDKS
ncbi:protein FAM47E-like [Saccoglossus kowalevskii]|uniref:Protein FAM47E-like n=1 Tax=Saccoglossus kowalevskii TaxID=10224 RepID=A0ABM0GQC2_SACKO|nr:PREDICTED: protein FAM47E-like [Saccoglossus kowalevskii]